MPVMVAMGAVPTEWCGATPATPVRCKMVHRPAPVSGAELNASHWTQQEGGGTIQMCALDWYASSQCALVAGGGGGHRAVASAMSVVSMAVGARMRPLPPTTPSLAPNAHGPFPMESFPLQPTPSHCPPDAKSQLQWRL